MLKMGLLSVIFSGCVYLQSVLSAGQGLQQAENILPVPLDRTIVIGAPDGTTAFKSYQTHPYVGYSKDIGSWKVLLEMSDAYSDNLSRGNLGTITEVLQLRLFGKDSTAATREFNSHATRVRRLLGQPRMCAVYRKLESTELRWEWTVAGRYFGIIHSRAPNDERLSVQWGGRALADSQRIAERCTWK